jgi:hypothetical protein
MARVNMALDGIRERWKKNVQSRNDVDFSVREVKENREGGEAEWTKFGNGNWNKYLLYLSRYMATVDTHYIFTTRNRSTASENV